MSPTNLIGISVTALLLSGFGWALIDLASRIVKQPKQAFNMLKLSPYPLVPDETTTQEHSGGERWDDLELQPVPIELKH